MVDTIESASNGHESFKAPKDFGELNFSEIQLKELPDYTLIPVSVDGQIFNLKITLKVGQANSDEEIDRREIRIYLIDKDEDPDRYYSVASPLLWGGLDFRLESPDDDTITVKTGIKKNKQNQTLPRGIGKILYTKMIDYIEDQRNFYQRDIKHVVNHLPSYGLNKDKWLENFQPLLETRGYTKISEEKENEKWEKTYYFDKNNNTTKI